ncbi:MAG: protein kinase [Polyangiales bacterium]
MIISGAEDVDPARFEESVLVGVGAYGSVYRAFDRQRGAEVALKVLHDAGSEAASYLKREFRTLSSIAHPNVVEFIDLVVSPERAYFTMEYLDAEPFSLGDVDEAARLGRILQAVRGLRCIHGAGFVHRDLKPPNVLVARDGRVVLLDCGLASRIPRDASRAGDPVGTLGFMAPEIWLGASPSPSQDLYALAVMVHEAITGRAVFPEDSFEESQRARQRAEFTPLTADDGIPGAVAALLNRALLPAPDDRPTLEDLEALLAEHLGGRARRRPPAPSAPLVGRASELASLRDVIEGHDARRALQLVGPSGVGKTRLIDEALARAPSELVVLRAACHPLEEVLLPALDGLIDPLAELIEAWPGAARRSLASIDGALGRVFPSLAPFLADAGEAGDPLTERRRAARALAALLAKVQARAPTLLLVDDAQWGDPGSWSLLCEAMTLARDEGPRLVVSARHAIDELAELGGVLTLGPLSPSDSRALYAAAARGESDAGLGPALSLAAGNPMALLALARRDVEVEAGARATSREAWLADALRARLADAPPRAWDMLVAAAAAGEPAPVSLLAATPKDPMAFESLRRRRLIDYDTSGAEQRVACAHGWVREAALRLCPADELRAVHLRLADGLIAADAAPERVVPHLRAGGDRGRLRGSALDAAARAEARLDFRRAAEFLEIAVDVCGDASTEAALRLAECLQRAGRGRRAGERYEALAARHDDADARKRLQRRAAEQFLYAGDHERGVAIVRRSLAEQGVRLVTNPLVAFAQTFIQHRGLNARGTRYAGPGDAATPADRARIDAVHNAALGLSMSEPLSSVALQASLMTLAADRGTLAQYVQALGIYVVQMAGYRYEPAKTAALVASVDEHLARVDDAAAGFFYLAASGAAWVEGRGADALRYADLAAERLTDRRRIDQWSLDSLQIVRASALAALGRYAQLRELVADALADARAREDLYLESNVCVRFATRAHLLEDRGDLALRSIDRGHSAWLGRRYGLLDFFCTLERAEARLYLGDLARARDELERGLRAARRALMLTVHFHRVLVADLRGRVALALAAERGDLRPLRDARRCVAELEAGASPLAAAMAASLRAGCLDLEGESAAARRAYAIAREGFEALAVEHRAAAAAWGAGDEAAALERLRAAGFANPGALARSLAPALRGGLVPGG